MSLKEHQSCSCFRLGGTDDVIVELCPLTWANLVQTVDEMQRVIMGAKISSNGTHPYYQFAYIIKCLFVAVRLSLAESHISPAIVMEVGNLTLPVSATMADTERDPCLEWTTPVLKLQKGALCHIAVQKEWISIIILIQCEINAAFYLIGHWEMW